MFISSLFLVTLLTFSTPLIGALSNTKAESALLTHTKRTDGNYFACLGIEAELQKHTDNETEPSTEEIEATATCLLEMLPESTDADFYDKLDLCIYTLGQFTTKGSQAASVLSQARKAFAQTVIKSEDGIYQRINTLEIPSEMPRRGTIDCLYRVARAPSFFQPTAI